MSTIVDDAICVRHWDFSETSQTVSLLLRDHGLIRALAKGAKRDRGRFSGGIDLLTRGQAVAIVKPGRELATLTDWDLQQTFRALRERRDANRAGFYLADVVARFVSDQAPHPRVFDAMVASLQALEDPEAVDAAVLRFQWVLLDEGGFRPRLAPEEGPAATAKAFEETGVVLFHPREGGVVGDARAGAWRVRRETIRLLKQLAEEGVIEPLNGPAVQRASRLLAACIREQLGMEPPTMRALFGEIPR